MSNTGIQDALQIRDVLYRDTKTGVTHDGVSAVAAIVALALACLVFYAQQEDQRRPQEIFKEATATGPFTASFLFLADGLTEKTRLFYVEKLDKNIKIQEAILITLGAFLVIFLWQYRCIQKDKEIDKLALIVAIKIVEWGAQIQKTGTAPTQPDIISLWPKGWFRKKWWLVFRLPA